MKKILFIANQFPPMGGSGVQRSVKFVKHLRSFGYEPIVLTREIENMLLKDETLLKDIPENTKIIRTKAYEYREMQGIMKIPGKVASRLMIPDSSRMWCEKTKKKALEIIRQEDIKLVYTTSAPYSDHLLGLYIKENIPEIKWTADFRDEWTNNPYMLDNPHNPIRMKIEKAMESKVLEKADMLITNTPVMRRNFIENNSLKGDNFFVIPNGYDEEDFEGLDSSKPNNERFTMVYTGALYGRRKPDTFFQALSELKKEGIFSKSMPKLRLIGDYRKNKLQSQIDSYSISDIAEIVGYVPHDECIRHQLGADCLVLIEGGGRGSDAFYTGKIFEYMNTNRPVLAILPKGAAADLVKESKIGEVAFTENVVEIKKIIKAYYTMWTEGRLDFKPDRGVIERYERKALTKELAQIFDRL